MLGLPVARLRYSLARNARSRAVFHGSLVYYHSDVRSANTIKRLCIGPAFENGELTLGSECQLNMAAPPQGRVARGVSRAAPPTGSESDLSAQPPEKNHSSTKPCFIWASSCNLFFFYVSKILGNTSSLALFTLKRKRHVSPNSESSAARDCEEKKGALIPQYENNATSTWNEAKQRFLHDSDMSRTKTQQFHLETKFKKDTRKPSKQEISSPRFFTQAWNFGTPERMSSPRCPQWRLNPKRMSRFRSKHNARRHGQPSTELPSLLPISTRRYVEYDFPNSCRTLSTIPEEEETLSQSSHRMLEVAGVDQDGTTSVGRNHDLDISRRRVYQSEKDAQNVCSRKSVLPVFNMHKDVPFSPRLSQYAMTLPEATPTPPYLSNPVPSSMASYLFDSSVFQDSTAQPEVTPPFSNPSNLKRFTRLTMSHLLNPYSAVCGSLHDAPTFFAQAGKSGHADPVPLRLISVARDSPIKRCLQDLARKKTQTRYSAPGSLEDIKMDGSFGSFDDLPTPWPQDVETEVVYPDLFRFSMYLDYHESSESIAGIGSIWGQDENIATMESQRLFIPSEAAATAKVTEEDYDQSEIAFNSKRFGRTFGSLANQDSSSQSQPVPERDMYRGTTYSRGHLKPRNNSARVASVTSLSMQGEGRVNTGARRLLISSETAAAAKTSAQVIEKARNQSEIFLSSKRLRRPLGPANRDSTPQPSGKDSYRSAAYSRPIAKLKSTFEMDMDNYKNGMRWAVLRGPTWKAGSPTTTKPQGANGNIEGTEGTAFSRCLAAEMENCSRRSNHDSIVQRLRDASWDITSLQWNEQEFLKMLKHSP
ncbi:hypothetical protein L218DRAFT_1078426 [Marasmius fiardii PR-910]|nr:hypothetical protein L218DRAFT_1078426 [Marasmius fiardii PR-910]